MLGLCILQGFALNFLDLICVDEAIGGDDGVGVSSEDKLRESKEFDTSKGK